MKIQHHRVCLVSDSFLSLNVQLQRQLLPAPPSCCQLPYAFITALIISSYALPPTWLMSFCSAPGKCFVSTSGRLSSRVAHVELCTEPWTSGQRRLLLSGSLCLPENDIIVLETTLSVLYTQQTTRIQHARFLSPFFSQQLPACDAFRGGFPLWLPLRLLYNPIEARLHLVCSILKYSFSPGLPELAVLPELQNELGRKRKINSV